jgi:phospholipase C
MKKLLAALVVLSALALAGPAPVRAQSAIGAFCGTQPRHPRRWAHVVWIWMENHSFDQIIGSADAPFINSVASSCGLATNFHNITHVSLANYIGAVTGLPLATLEQSQFQFDCNPSTTCSTAAPSIFQQVASWKVYMESMTTNCQPTGLVGYAVRHNPPAYLTSLTDCATFDVPYTALQSDLDNDTLPAFSMIVPNTVNDMHDGPDPGAIHNGDAWLATELPKIVNSAAYQAGNTVVFITFDEGETAGLNFGEDCANNTTDESCHIPTIVVSPSTPDGTTSAKLYNHYSLLRTTERLLGIHKRLGLARHARIMKRPFNL